MPDPAQHSATRPKHGVGRLLRSAVLLFSLLCLGWVLWPIATNARELAATVEGGRLVLWVLLGIAAYAALSTLLAIAWWWLAGIYGDRPSLRAGYAVFARSQLAKYLPGNAFHFVSRQLLGRRAGLSHPALVASGFLEMGSLLLASLFAAAFAFGQAARTGALGVWWGWVVAAAGISLLAWPACDALLRRIPRTARWMGGLPRLSVRDTLRLLGPSLLCHTIFFLGTGFILLMLVGAAAPDATGSFSWRILGVYPLAWMAGTVTVGAPAGVGVREAVLSLELGTVLTPAQAAAAALALRLVTLGGDLLTALVGWWLDRERT